MADARAMQAAHEYARYLTGSQVATDVPGYQQAPGLRRSNTAYDTSPAREVIATDYQRELDAPTP